MADPIDFYFDFSSPYGYFASQRIDGIARKHARAVAWHPFLLGVVFRVTGQSPLPEQPMRGDYALHDFDRSARLYGVPFAMPEKFPIPGQVPSRAFYWLHDRNPAQAKDFAKAAYGAYFAKGRDITDVGEVARIAKGVGADADALAAALAGDPIKERLKAEVQAAIDRGVFGSPFVIVDGEAFWGADRLDHVEAWLATGGW